MLLSFRVVNHRSFRSEHQLNLAPAYEADRPRGTKWPAVPVAAVFGANASGKSNLIDALAYLRDMALNSDRIAEPGYGIIRSPFALDPDEAAEPSWYDIDGVIDGVRHTFGFGVDDDKVVEEWLHRYPIGRRQVVYERHGAKFRFGTTVDADLSKAVAITPDNVLFISSAARSGQGDVQAAYRWLRQIEVRGSSQRRPEVDLRYPLTRLLRRDDYRRKVLALLNFADFGIMDIGVENVESPAPSAHQRVWFQMKGAKPGVRLTLAEQSAGTRTFLDHLPNVLDCLANGSILIMDELESNLHPNLAGHIVQLFQDPTTNPRGAQLIFTTHNTSLLASNNELLKRDQIWFVEKNFEEGWSSLYPLSDFKPRDKENIERRYLGGSYGAIPFIDGEVARSALLDTPAAEVEE
jgi:hypothetical protein